jgi:methyltransferase
MVSGRSAARDPSGQMRIIFTGLLGLLAAQRLWELRLSRRNEAWLRAAGAREPAGDYFTWMKLLHSSWFVATLLEVWWLKRPFRPLPALLSFILLLVGQSLRYAAICNLGRRWSVRVITLPGAPPARNGIYRFLRHPNYLGVGLELASVPLLHGGYLTAAVYTALNAVLLKYRIRVEEAALRGSGESFVTSTAAPHSS